MKSYSKGMYYMGYLGKVSAEDVPAVIDNELQFGDEMSLLGAGSWVLSFHLGEAQRARYIASLAQSPTPEAGALLRAIAELLGDGPLHDVVADVVDKRTDRQLDGWVYRLGEIRVGPGYQIKYDKPYAEEYVVGYQLPGRAEGCVAFMRKPADGPIKSFTIEEGLPAVMGAREIASEVNLNRCATRLPAAQFTKIFRDALDKSPTHLIDADPDNPWGTWPLHRALAEWVLRKLAATSD